MEGFGGVTAYFYNTEQVHQEDDSNDAQMISSSIESKDDVLNNKDGEDPNLVLKGAYARVKYYKGIVSSDDKKQSKQCESHCQIT